LKTITIFNQKGGVGKTTTALSLSAASHLKGGTPLLIDLDPHGHLTSVHPKLEDRPHQLFDFYKNNIPLSDLVRHWPEVGSFIASSRDLTKVDTVFGKGPTILHRLKLGLAQFNDVHTKRTLTILDCCPYIGVLSLNAIFAADLIVVPIGSDFLSLEAAKQVQHTLNALQPVLKNRVERCYLLTNYDRRRNMTFEVQKKAIELFGEDVCKTKINTNVAVAESLAYKKTIFQHSPNSAAAKDYMELYAEVADRLSNITTSLT
jgi:chromosome partitioning protein